MSKNPAAVELGRKGGKARVKNQTAAERKESARRAARARWEKEKADTQKQISELASAIPKKRRK